MVDLFQFAAASLTLSSSGTISGTPSPQGTANFTVQVTDSTTPTNQTATATLSITVAPPPTPVVDSSNWSGYAVSGGPFTAAEGTFNVPNLYAASGETDTSEWVGIDGASNSSLIQAGVNEEYDPSTNLVYLTAWWEILPAAETPISMSLAPGDEMTVTIGQVSGTLWEITITDDTTERTYSTEQDYTGPGASAEWIVEAPTSGSGTIYTLGDYTPYVTFSSLGINGTETGLDEFVMIQRGAIVSVPSALVPAGFTVAYGDVAAAAP